MEILAAAFWITLCLLLFYLVFVSPFIVKPFLEGVREANKKIEVIQHAYPKHCPMCGEQTLMTYELRCAHCGEMLGPSR